MKELEELVLTGEELAHLNAEIRSLSPYQNYACVNNGHSIKLYVERKEEPNNFYLVAMGDL